MTPSTSKTTVRRRGVLRGIGAGGLAAAVAVFAKGSPAQAANWECCNLVYVPPNVSLSNCLASNHQRHDHRLGVRLHLPLQLRLTRMAVWFAVAVAGALLQGYSP